MDLAFGALADPTRRAIVERLYAGEATVGEVAEPFRMSAPAITKHLKVLEGAGLVRRRREGRHHVLHLVPEPLDALSGWIERHRRLWERSLDRLEAYLRQEASEAEGDRDASERTKAPSKTKGKGERP